MLPNPVDNVAGWHYQARIGACHMKGSIVIGPPVDMCCLLNESGLIWNGPKRYQMNKILVVPGWLLGSLKTLDPDDYK